jgi:hypothetical protein
VARELAAQESTRALGGRGMDLGTQFPVTRRRRYLLIVLTLVGGSLIAGYWSVRPGLSRWVKHQLAEHIERHFDGNVEVDTLDVSLFPTVRVDGTGLKLVLRQPAGAPPLITAKAFSAETSVLRLWRGGVKDLTVTGLVVTVPPDGLRNVKRKKGGAPQAAAPAPPMPLPADTDSPNTGGITVDRITASDARLEITPDDPDGEPLVFDIDYAQLKDFSPSRPASYEAHLTNPRPRGEIVSAGKFGPWRADAPRLTQLGGNYSLTKADMSVFKGLSGFLYSTGTFEGQLDSIAVKGNTSIPDFEVETGRHPMLLETSFVARVDGTNGNTYLERVSAKLGQSSLTASGEVAGRKGGPGKTIRLQVDSSDSRLEDFIHLVVSAKQAPMRGQLAFSTRMVLPPGDASVLDSLQLAGTFSIRKGRFTSDLVQDKVDELSRKGQGQPKNMTIDNVLSGFAGRYTLRDGQLNISRLQFGVQGADVVLEGTYGLRGERLDFIGELKLDATVSQTTTGFRSVLLRAVDPFFKKRGAGTVLPIRISGSVGQPEFKLNLFAKKAKTQN